MIPDIQLIMQFKGVSDIESFAKGKRGIIYTGTYKGKKVAIKCKNPESKAVGRIENEARWIEKLNLRGIGPGLLYHCPEYFIYEFVEGEFIVDYIKGCPKSEAIAIIKDIFCQCFIMDQIGVNKEEMHRPLRHIIISGGKPVMIDFERARNTEKPKNVTQFCQFVSCPEFVRILLEKGIEIDKDDIRKLAKEYKGDMSKEKLNKILEHLE